MLQKYIRFMMSKRKGIIFTSVHLWPSKKCWIVSPPCCSLPEKKKKRSLRLFSCWVLSCSFMCSLFRHLSWETFLTSPLPYLLLTPSLLLLDSSFFLLLWSNDLKSKKHIPYFLLYLSASLFDWGFLGGSDGKESSCNVGDPSSILQLGRSPGEGNGNPLQHFCLETSTTREAWQATVHGITKSQTQLSN